MIFEQVRARAAARPARTPTKFQYILQLHLSWAPTDEEALANAMTEWPNGGMKFPKQDIRSPHDFEQMAKLVRPEDFEGRMLISSDPDAAPGRDPEVPRPRLRPDLPPQRRPQPGRVDRGLRPRGPAEAHGVALTATRTSPHTGGRRWISASAPSSGRRPTLAGLARRRPRGRGGRLGRRLDVGPPDRDLRAVGAADLRGLDDARRLVAAVTSRSDARPDGRREHVPQPGPDRQARDDPRPRQRRPGRSSASAAPGSSGSTTPSASSFGVGLRRAARPARRGGRAPAPAARRRAGHPRGPLLHVPRRALPAAAGPGPPADPDRRLRAAEDAPDRRALRRRLEHRGHRRGGPGQRCGSSASTARPSGRDPARSS